MFIRVINIEGNGTLRNLCISGTRVFFDKNQNSRERDLNFSIRVSGSLLAKNPLGESWELELGRMSLGLFSTRLESLPV